MPPPTQPFPDIQNKLQAPTKKSAFEKAKADAEAKRLREEAETAAVYEDFVKSFADESDDEQDRNHHSNSQRDGRGGGFGGPGGARPPPVGPSSGKRHFTSSTRGGIPMPPPLGGGFNRFGKKRGYDSQEDYGDRDRTRRMRGDTGILAFENSGTKDQKEEGFFVRDQSDDEEERREAKEQPKPTLHLSSLPPTFTADDIRQLLREHNPDIVIDSVKLLPPSTAPSTNSAVRRAASAIVMLSHGTPSADVDSCATTLSNRYLGGGFWLSISRHLPSTVIGSEAFSALAAKSDTSSNPFGAKLLAPVQHKMNRAPPPARGFAPPPQFGGSAQPQQNNYRYDPRGRLEVQVSAPKDLKLLRTVHKTIESVLTHGPDFEALLMNSDEARYDERWSWLWDTRSPTHQYYRWRLWDILSGTSAKPSSDPKIKAPFDMFTGAQTPVWVPPKKRLKYEFATSLHDITDDPDYRSEEESDSESEAEVEQPQGVAVGGLGIAGDDHKRRYLTPLERAKLIHLIARVPTSTTKVRRGDVARIMAFAIEHAWAAEEVVEVLVQNILRPFALQREEKGLGAEPGDEDEKEEDEAKKDETDRERDTSGAKIVGLYLINDVLSNSSLGIRNVWRYRTLVESKLKEAKVMEELGRVPEKEGWGRIRKEKYKRLIGSVLQLWENWCTFPQTSHELLTKAFMDPPSLEATTKPATTETAASSSRWRKIDDPNRPTASSATTDAPSAPAWFPKNLNKDPKKPKEEKKDDKKKDDKPTEKPQTQPQESERDWDRSDRPRGYDGDNGRDSYRQDRRPYDGHHDSRDERDGRYREPRDRDHRDYHQRDYAERDRQDRPRDDRHRDNRDRDHSYHNSSHSDRYRDQQDPREQAAGRARRRFNEGPEPMALDPKPPAPPPPAQNTQNKPSAPQVSGSGFKMAFGKAAAPALGGAGAGAAKDQEGQKRKRIRAEDMFADDDEEY
ncbi:hypothetical protein BJ508DRAFT_412183 [Ascobolus immersus RN42]|uniref:CID domain-containing protein n=1 Tax=Ascobolus immersus RN42 TaxID=1160509 RepID=A0A3N4IUY1_ASCIM|nr:hypothetical protein BJ508DRAFT_412183 [Ascobolus immersus RN42]